MSLSGHRWGVLLCISPRSGPVGRGVRAALAIAVVALLSVAPASASQGATWSAWISSATDPGIRLAEEAPTDAAGTATVDVHPDERGQTWLGAGAALTDSAAGVLAGSTEAAHLLFDPGRPDGAHLNLVRLPLSATDFSTTPWTFGWDDASQTLTAPPQAVSDAGVLTGRLLPLRPDLKVVATPWTAPPTMKDSGSADGGALLDSSVASYGRMLAAQAAWLRQRGVPLGAMTLGNEPYTSSSSYPTMLLSDGQQAALADELGPTLARAGTELWAVDHNWADRAHYDALESGSPERYQASAFHCYAGSPGAMAGVRERPILTECTGTTDGFAGTLPWDADNLVIDAIQNGSVGLLMWNLALDQSHGPHTGGCTTCRGVVDVDSGTGAVVRNTEFYTLAQLTRAADPGAAVIGTDAVPGLGHVAFHEPDGEVGLFAYNSTGTSQVVEVTVDGQGTGGRFVVPAHAMISIRGGPRAAPSPPAPAPPAPPTAVPVLSRGAVHGTVRVGRRLRVRGTRTLPHALIRRHWLHDGRPISGRAATHAAYRIRPVDRGARLAVRVTISAPGYASTSFVVGDVRVHRRGG